ncbi:MAG: GC-type dockerin domain-anchored protein [Phycisphaerales bacterium]|jgi:hypothetical protein|nr:hypothetical protein [Phycisphaeraceae bacterium]
MKFKSASIILASLLSSTALAQPTPPTVQFPGGQCAGTGQFALCINVNAILVEQRTDIDIWDITITTQKPNANAVHIVSIGRNVVRSVTVINNTAANNPTFDFFLNGNINDRLDLASPGRVASARIRKGNDPASQRMGLFVQSMSAQGSVNGIDADIIGDLVVVGSINADGVVAKFNPELNQGGTIGRLFVFADPQLAGSGNLLGPVRAVWPDPTPNVFTRGFINRLVVDGTIGSPGAPVAIEATRNIGSIEAPNGSINAAILTPTDIGFVQAASIGPASSIDCRSLTLSGRPGQSGLQVAGAMAGLLRIRESFVQPSASIAVGSLPGQVIINGRNVTPAGVWGRPIIVAGSTLSNAPAGYLTTPAALQGGAVGVAPFRIHRTAGTPAYDVATGTVSGTINNTNTGSAQVFPAVAFYGPVKPQVGQTTLLTLQRFVGANYVAVPAGEVSFSVIDDGAFDRRVRIAPASGTRPAGFRLRPGQYRATTTTALRCDLVSDEPAVSSEGEFLFTIIDGCGVADIANTDGEYLPDNVVDNGDFNAFFAAFFRDETDLDRFFADIANTDGDPSADGLIDNGDFTAFFAAFFVGCSPSSLGGGSGGESMLAALGAGGQGIDLSALTSAQLTARLEQLRALGRPVTLQDLQTIMPEVFVGGAGDQ